MFLLDPVYLILGVGKARFDSRQVNSTSRTEQNGKEIQMYICRYEVEVYTSINLSNLGSGTDMENTKPESIL
jgi:hypothetical protein